MSCDYRNIPDTDVDNNTFQGQDKSTYYMATDQLFPIATPYLEKNNSKTKTGILVASQEDLNTKEQAPVIFSSSILVDEENNNEPIEETTETTEIAETDVESESDTAIVVKSDKSLVNAIVTNSGIRCECPPPPTCPTIPPCPNLDYKWMQTNFFILLALLIVSIVLVWTTRNRR